MDDSHSLENTPQYPFIKNIFDAIADGVLVIDREGSIRAVNPALEEILERPAAELVDRGWGECFLAEEANLDFTQTVVEVVQTRQVFHNAEVSYLTPKGRRRELIATTSLIRDPEGRLLGVVAVFKDVTRLKAYHRSQLVLTARARRHYEERREGLDRIAKAVAHEVRNPVTAIGGLAGRLLGEVAPDGRQADYLRRIKEAAGRLERVVRQVHAYANLPRPRLVPVAPAAWLGELLASYQETAARQGVRLNLTAKGEPRCRLDPQLMGKAVRHLVDNALEAMPRGGELAITAAEEPPDVVLTIADTGRGIAPADLPFVFDPFFTTKADAVGMSLSLTKRVVEEHEGTLSLASRPGEGTVCRLRLPIDPAAAVEASPRPPEGCAAPE